MSNVIKVLMNDLYYIKTSDDTAKSLFTNEEISLNGISYENVSNTEIKNYLTTLIDKFN